MEELRFVVDRLNEPPFSKQLTLVTFDELGPQELLQTLNEVLEHLDSDQKRNVRDEASEALSARMVRFLQILRYEFPQGDSEEYKRALAQGARPVVYPILYYLLSRLPALEKRAYVAKFMAPVEIPPEFLHEEAVQEAIGQIRVQQGQFKEVHKAVEAHRARQVNPRALSKEVQQLEDERRQLSDRIATLRERTAGQPQFKALLEETSKLRKEQERETKLQERLADQRHALAAATKRYEDTARRLAETRANTKEDMTAEQLMQSAQREHRDSTRLAERDLPRALEARRGTLQRLQQQLEEPAKSHHDCQEVEMSLRATEEAVRRLTEEIAQAEAAAGDQGLARFRRLAGPLSKRLRELDEQIVQANQELEEASREVEAKETRLSELSGPQFMRHEDFKAYAETLRAKTQEFRRLKGELEAVQRESVVLDRTQQLLKGRAGNIDELLKRLEASRGVTGYTSVQAGLERVSKEKEQVDELKGATLTEISRLVANMQQQLQSKRQELQPQLDELRQVRGEYTELDKTYRQAKDKYDGQAAGFKAQRTQLERECDALQEDVLRHETEYHTLQSDARELSARLQRAREEAQYRMGGQDVLLRDFRTWRDLLDNKLRQQEQLAKSLRAQQTEIRENAGEYVRQRQLFQGLQRLMEAKLGVYQEHEAQLQAAADGDGGGDGDGDYDSINVGGANVMTLA